MRVLRTSMIVAALVAGACSAGEEAATSTLPATSGPTTSGDAAPITTPPDTTADGGTTEPPAGNANGGAVVIAVDMEPTTLNPYAPGGGNEAVAAISQAHMAGVFDIDPDTLDLIPELVAELPTVGNGGVVENEDGTVDVTWTLREEAVWSDGRPIAGADLAFTLEFQRTSLETCAFAFAPDPPPELEVIAVGDKSLTARFAEPSLQHEGLFRWVVPAHAVADTDYCEDWNDVAWPAAGPFVVTQWERSEAMRALRLSRNPNYWKLDGDGDSLPYLDGVEFRFVADLAELVDAFDARQVDVINPTPNFAELPIDEWRKAGAEVQVVEGPFWEHLNFQFGTGNRNAESLNGILEFRQAVAHALDRRLLLDDAGYPWLAVSNGFMRHSNRSATTDPWQRYTTDADLARELLGAACVAAGRDCGANPPTIVFTTTSNTGFRSAIAEQVAAQLVPFGIQVVLELEDSQLFFGDTFDVGSWDMGMWAWAGDPGAAGVVDQVRVFHPDEAPPDGDNVYRWGSPGSVVEGQEASLQVRLIIDEMRTSADGERVLTLASQLEDILADQVVIIPLTGRAVVGAAWGDRVQGFRMNPSSATHIWNVERWHRP